MKKEIAIIIPAYNPNNKMVEMIKQLKEKYDIVVIDDGSEEKHKKYFKECEKDIILLTNEKNQGKGFSLKKGIKEIEKTLLEDIIGVITADSDGQHRVEDIIKIAEKMKQNAKNKNEKIILGNRNFKQKKIPIRNKIGNIIMTYLVKRKTGIKIKDTQTGLRGIPKEYIKEIKSIKGNRYEYEQNVLLKILEIKIPIEEIEIETVYQKGNKSYFRRIKDSYKIVKTLKK